MHDAEPIRQSLLGWFFSSLGLVNVVVLLAAGLLSFFIAIAIVTRGRGPMAAVALLLAVPIPMLYGIFAAIRGAISSYTVIAMSSSTPKPAELAVGISAALVAPMIGMLVMIPGFAVALIGSLFRAISESSKSSEES